MGNDKAKALLGDAEDKVKAAAHDVESDLKADAAHLKERLAHHAEEDAELKKLITEPAIQQDAKKAEGDMAVDAVMLGHEE